MPLRQALESFRASDPKNLRSHPGLWIDKMLPDEEPSSMVAGPLLKSIARPPIPDGYATAFATRRSGFEVQADREQASLFDAQSAGRMVIGLGAKGILEMGITLDHTWGVPYLPGSALKGIAASAAHRFSVDPTWKKFDKWPEAAPPREAAELTDYQVLFGTTGNGGVVAFHDAWWDPSGESSVPIELDVMTVHHPEYYQASQNPTAPTDFDQPVPVPFLSARGRFLIAIEGPAAWREVAAEWLRIGLRELGIGAKTSSGYGRFELAERLTDALRARRAKTEAMERMLARYRVNEKQAAVDAVVGALAAGVSEERLRVALGQVDKGHRDSLVDGIVARSPGHASVVKQALAAISGAPAHAPATQAAVAPSEPALEVAESRTRARYEPDRKNPKRFFVRLEEDDRQHKGHTLDIEPELLEAMRGSGDWTEVIVATTAGKRRLRRG